MENASKALIIAGEVLIGVLVASLIATVFATFGRFSFNMNSRIEQNNVLIFNNHFTVFDGRIDITAQEIASLINFAKQSNDEYELNQNGKTSNGKDSPFFVEIQIDNIKFFANANNYSNLDNDILDFISLNNLKYFCCNVNINTTYIKTNNGKDTIIVSRKDLGDIQYNNQTTMVNKITFKSIEKIENKDFNVKVRDDFHIE